MAMRKFVPAIMLACAGLAAVPPALAQGKRYEAPQRLRVGAMDTCLKDEVMNGAYCVKQCAEGFRMEMGKRDATCIATSADAKVPPPRQPGYVTPDKPPPQGAKGT
ncbi:hypothetical protein BWI17_08440 [Betaproteobacteria bacterium GR16-43]|nr:hypothetical protein BWI17_08440 [Betaproteobacteria bacterium GR16-43]